MKSSVILLGTAFVLAACGHPDSGRAPAVAPPIRARAPAVVKRGPTAEEMTQGMVEAVGVGKSALPVRVKFELSQRPVVGHAIELGIAVLPEISAGPASVSITGTEGLIVAAADVQRDLPAVEENQVYRQTLNVTPTAEGMQMLTVNVMLHHDDANDTRAFAVPVIVSPP